MSSVAGSGRLVLPERGRRPPLRAGWWARARWFWAPAVVACASPTATPPRAPVASVMASDAEIEGILAERVPGEHPGFGIVVGVIEPAGRRVVSRGERSQGDPAPLDADTLFEI